MFPLFTPGSKWFWSYQLGNSRIWGATQLSQSLNKITLTPELLRKYSHLWHSVLLFKPGEPDRDHCWGVSHFHPIPQQHLWWRIWANAVWYHSDFSLHIVHVLPVHFQKLLCLVEGEEVGSHAKQSEAFLLKYLQHRTVFVTALYNYIHHGMDVLLAS